ncbi:MAG: hypothetical protein CO012_06695 [Syntrophobacterales bacterium CG_4_8_14_3_um_filter_49_14]|nr:MAG: hypothetical protein CO012_06695 [Syntrophobacterales bacterium CG_4_8_14_3_um_filter_49_14]
MKRGEEMVRCRSEGRRLILSDQRGKGWFLSPGVMFLVVIGFVFCIGGRFAYCQGWSPLEIRALPESSFAVVEKDQTGKKIKRCPHHDANGKLDEEQLIYVLGTIDRETFLAPKKKEEARRHLETHYDRFNKDVLKEEIQGHVRINTASLTELVTLPNVGPVLAVKIVEYRKEHTRFETVEDIMKVGGIGKNTFNAIRHYITAE